DVNRRPIGLRSLRFAFGIINFLRTTLPHLHTCLELSLEELFRIFQGSCFVDTPCPNPGTSQLLRLSGLLERLVSIVRGKLTFTPDLWIGHYHLNEIANSRCFGTGARELQRLQVCFPFPVGSSIVGYCLRFEPSRFHDLRRILQYLFHKILRGLSLGILQTIIRFWPGSDGDETLPSQS